MTTTQEQVLNLLSHVLFGTSSAVSVTQKIIEEAKAQSVSTLNHQGRTEIYKAIHIY